MNSRHTIYTGLIVGLCAFSTTTMANDLRINGFFSVGAGKASTDEFESSGGISGYNDEFSVNEDTILGLQFTKPVNDKVTLNAQLFGTEGKSNYDIEASWAFASYQATDDLSVRVGRMRVPYFLYSEFLSVSYAYPWIRPPRAFTLPFSEADGINSVFTANAGDTDISIEAYVGELEVEDNELAERLHIKDMSGVAVTVTGLDLTLRASYHWLTVDVYGFGPANASAEPDASNFTEAGLIYDDGSIFGFFEFSNQSHPDELKATRLVVDNNTYIATLGYRFDQFMPHITYDLFRNSDDNVDRSSLIYGVRWDIEASTAVKFQYQSERLDNDGAETKGNLISASLDLVF